MVIVFTISQAGSVGRINEGKKKGVIVKVFPLYTILKALQVTQVDYFSLDIEGHEMKVTHWYFSLLVNQVQEV